MRTETAREDLTSGRPQDLRAFFDLVKAAAITGIFAFHFYDIYLGLRTSIDRILRTGVLQYHFADGHHPADLVIGALKTIASFGGAGAPLFIIASGFGLTFSHLSKACDWPAFYKRRFLRVVPLYYVAVVLALAVNLVLSRGYDVLAPAVLRPVLFNLLFLHNLSRSFNIYGAFYFVAVIVQLYLLFPLLLKLAVRTRSVGIVSFLLTFLVSPVIMKLLDMAGIRFTGTLPTDHLPYFFFGMLLGVSAVRDRNTLPHLFNRRYALGALVGCLLMVWLFSYHVQYGRATAFLIVFPIFFSLPLLAPVAALPPVKAAITKLAYGSYALYLVHLQVIKLGLSCLAGDGASAPGTSWMFAAVLLFAASAALATIIQTAYDRILKSRREAAA